MAELGDEKGLSVTFHLKPHISQAVPHETRSTQV